MYPHGSYLRRKQERKRKSAAETIQALALACAYTQAIIRIRMSPQICIDIQTPYVPLFFQRAWRRYLLRKRHQRGVAAHTLQVRGRGILGRADIFLRH